MENYLFVEERAKVVCEVNHMGPKPTTASLISCRPGARDAAGIDS